MAPRRFLQRIAPQLWPAVILLVGAALSVFLGYTLQRGALETWQKRAEQEATQQSMTLLSWIEESYGMLSGIVALVENTSKVDGEVFLNAVDGLEARAKVNFIQVKAMMESRNGGWNVKYSTAAAEADPTLPRANAPPTQLLTDILARSQDMPNEWFMSAPFTVTNGGRYVYVVLVPAGKTKVALVGVLGLQRMLESLFAASSGPGMFLDFKLKPDGSDEQFTVASTIPAGTVIHRSSTQTQTAHANLDLTWQFSNEFYDGVDRRLAWGVGAGGVLLSALVALFILSLNKQNRRIAQRVDEATRELEISLKSAEVASLEKSSALAELERSSARLALENDERLKSEQRTRLILNSAGEGIFGVDAEEKVTFFNDAAVSLLGYSAEEVTDREIYSLIHHSHADGTPRSSQECPLHIAVSKGGPAKISEDLFWRKDGSHFLGEYSVTPILADRGGSAGAVVVFRDTTEQRKNQQELEQRMEELERFNRLTMGREERMIQLKRDINALLDAQHMPRRYRDNDEGDAPGVEA